MFPMAKIGALYHVRCGEAEVERVARAIAIEQTVEVPEWMVSGEIEERIVGKVGPIERLAEDRGFAVTIHYDADLANGQLPQLLNLVYGNVSIKDAHRLVDLALPEELLAGFRGPSYGSKGVRALLGVYDRPLLATALKPRGTGTKVLARIAGDFARGGGDLVKDDHNLVDTSVDAFRERIALCQQAVSRANEETGRNCLYVPNLYAPSDSLEEFAECAVREGVAGVLVAPMILGLDTVRHLAARYPLVIMGHPSFSGTFYQDRDHGIEPGLLLGTLYRLAGVDVTIFTNFGGRLGLSRTECCSIVHHVRAPLGELRSGLPCPAGGLQLDHIPDMAEQCGYEALYLIGGALLGHGESVRASVVACLDRIGEHFAEELVEPGAELLSSCALPGVQEEALHHLVFQPDFRWRGRTPSQYKNADAKTLPFKEVVRHELLGRSGERTSFELRYFEIAPGGFSSREKHLHAHAIVALRGEGLLDLGDERIELRPHDVAYVPPLSVHQLRNEATDQPFGFLCIVDRHRDRPRAS
jgi:ribulose-bisphosphate carboxylase large chain